MHIRLTMLHSAAPLRKISRRKMLHASPNWSRSFTRSKLLAVSCYRTLAAFSVRAESRAVRSCFSHANGRPSMARLIVFSNTSEKTWR
jgi:hypothetical protein